MSDRFSPLAMESETRREFQEGIEKHYGSNPKFSWQDQNGAPMGPFAVLSYTPDLVKPSMAFADAILEQKDFTPRCRELSCLAVAAVYDVPFIRYAHQQVALTVGLSPEQVASALSGVLPGEITDIEAVVYTTSLSLARNRGPLDKESWQRAEETLGKAGAARMGHVVGLYVYNSVLLNLGAVVVPPH